MLRWSLAGLAALAAVAGLLWLGLWQLHRLEWKEDLIARVDERVAADPAPLPIDWAYTTAARDEYRRTRVTGTFRHEAELQVQAVTELGPGYWVMTPLVTPEATIWINRGFVPPDRRDPATRAEGQIPGPVTITGLLRMTEPKGGFLRSNDPAAGRWFSRDVAAMSLDRKLGPVAPWFIDADATPNPGGLPVGGLTVITFRNNHLGYALTWLLLAAGLAAASIYVLRERLRRENGPALPRRKGEEDETGAWED